VLRLFKFVAVVHPPHDNADCILDNIWTTLYGSNELKCVFFYLKSETLVFNNYDEYDEYFFNSMFEPLY
jgi:hypothetical protein